MPSCRAGGCTPAVLPTGPHTMKILIVEDSRVVRHILVRTLRQAGHVGHEVIHAADGHEGLSALEVTIPTYGGGRLSFVAVT